MAGRVLKLRSGPHLPEQRRELRVLAGVLLAVAGTLCLIYLLLAADFRQDLSEAQSQPGAEVFGSPVVSWRSLQAEGGPRSGASRQAGPPDGTAVSMLGYMMLGRRAAFARSPEPGFTLMPNAGSWMHAARHEPDEMVEVRPPPGATVPYVDRRLVWVKGRFSHLRSRLHGGDALYGINDAQVHEASEKDLARWFLP